MVPSRCSSEIAAPSPSASDSKKVSNVEGETPRETTPSSVPSGAATLRAITVVQPLAKRLCTSAITTSGDFGSVLNFLK